jgi:hypothetical protein
VKIHEQWIEALLPEPVELGGVRLHPLTCGHVLLLVRLTGWQPLGTVYGSGDIPLGLYVCSRPWREAWAGVGSRRANRFLRSLAGRVSIPEVARGWQQYLESALVIPRFRRKQREGVGGQVPGAPFLLRLRYFAMSELNQDDETFNDLGFADLVWLWLVRAEDLGEIRLQDDAEAAFMEWADEQDRLRREESNGHREPMGTARA